MYNKELEAFLLKHNLSLASLGRLIGFDRKTISKWAGKNRLQKYQQLILSAVEANGIEESYKNRKILWSAEEEKKLMDMIASDIRCRAIASQLNKTKHAVHAKYKRIRCKATLMEAAE